MATNSSERAALFERQNRTSFFGNGPQQGGLVSILSILTLQPKVNPLHELFPPTVSMFEGILNKFRFVAVVVFMLLAAFIFFYPSDADGFWYSGKWIQFADGTGAVLNIHNSRFEVIVDGEVVLGGEAIAKGKRNLDLLLDDNDIYPNEVFAKLVVFGSVGIIKDENGNFEGFARKRENTLSQ